MAGEVSTVDRATQEIYKTLEQGLDDFINLN